MKTFMRNPSCRPSEWLNRGSIDLLKKSRLKNLMALLFCCFLLSSISYSQNNRLMKGYSKANYLAQQQSEQELLQQEKKAAILQQLDEKCGFIYIEEMLNQKYPNRGTKQQFEEWMQQNIATDQYGGSRMSVITIPVVVHVIHNGEAIGLGANISDAQVLSQLVVLNEDFRRLNADAGNTPDDFLPVAADGEIEFCLATVTPDGTTGPTVGIHRYNGNQSSYSISDLENTVKPQTAWNPEYYFNIWVAPLQGGLLGYAQFPSMSTLDGMPANGGPDYTDGIVVRDFAFGTNGSALGPWNLGRTATHEAGHFFGLRHNGGDGGCDVDDFVTDTPTQIGQNNNFESDCSYPAGNDCIDPGTDYPDMFMNYMDYSDDACMNLFTLGQKVRFDVVLANSPRRNFDLSEVCYGVQPPEWVVELPEPPANDLCEDAIPVLCGSSVDGTTTGATIDNVGFCGTSNTAPGVWYSFEASGSITELSTCNQADYDTKISVFSGTCGSLSCIGGQDDEIGCAGFTTNLTVNTTPGETYYVLIHGFGNASGNFTLTLGCPAPPANDLCENAIALQCDETVTGNTELANDTGAITDCSDDPWTDTPGIGVWYTIEGTGGEITLSTCNTANFDTRIDVFTGSCGSLTCYAGNDDGPGCVGFTSELTFSSNVGETYLVYVSGFSTAVGDFELSVDCACVADAGDCATVYIGYDPAECTDLTASAFYGNPPYSYSWSTGETSQTITVCPTLTTTYTVTVSDEDGCVSTDQVTVDVIDVQCGKKNKKVEICHIPPGNPDNPQMLCVSANAVSAHLAHGDHLGECGIEPCDGLYVGNNSKSVKNISSHLISKEDWNVYPNPAGERASIDLSILQGYEIEVRVIDATGRILWSYPLQVIESPVLEINMNTIPSGVYNVVLKTNSQSMVKRLVVTK